MSVRRLKYALELNLTLCISLNELIIVIQLKADRDVA